MDRKTVGQIYTDLYELEPARHTPTEQMEENLTDWDANMEEVIQKGLKATNSDFYIVVETRKESLMERTLRNQFFWRYTCPTPMYDETVFKYHRSSNHIEFLWVIPDKYTCEWMRDNILLIPPEQKELLGFVLGLYDDSLVKLAKKLNGEELITPLIEKKQQWATASPLLLASNQPESAKPEKKLVLL